MRLGRTLVALSIAAVVAAGCGGDSGGDTAGGAGGGSVTLSAANSAFSPPDLAASIGDTIEFNNEDDAKHSFTAEDAGIDEDAEGGESVSIPLSNVEAGTYAFVCKYHPDMKGTLEVTQ